MRGWVRGRLRGRGGVGKGVRRGRGAPWCAVRRRLGPVRRLLLARLERPDRLGDSRLAAVRLHEALALVHERRLPRPDATKQGQRSPLICMYMSNSDKKKRDELELILLLLGLLLLLGVHRLAAHLRGAGERRASRDARRERPNAVLELLDAVHRGEVALKRVLRYRGWRSRRLAILERGGGRVLWRRSVRVRWRLEGG